MIYIVVEQNPQTNHQEKHYVGTDSVSAMECMDELDDGVGTSDLYMEMWRHNKPVETYWRRQNGSRKSL